MRKIFAITLILALSSVSIYASGKTGIDADVAAAKALRTTPSYLLDGDETTIPESYISELSEAEQRVIMAYRQASEERRQIADDILLPKQ